MSTGTRYLDKKRPAASSVATTHNDASNKFRVVQKSKPCNGSDDDVDVCTTARTIGEYVTLTKARDAALAERDSMPQFDGWAEEHYDSDDGNPKILLHYHTADCPDPSWLADEDEFVSIFIQDMSKEQAQQKAAIKRAKLSKPPRRSWTVNKSRMERKFGPTRGNFKPDIEIFLRNACRIQGGISRHPSEYGNYSSPKTSYAYLLQRLSDRNYAMRGSCLDEEGARYSTFKKFGYISKAIAWIPDSNLNDHNETTTRTSILDTFHSDLVHHETGKALVTNASLLQAAETPDCNKDSIFVNNLEDAKAVAETIDKCSSTLQCISLVETEFSTEVVDALHKARNTLRGITIATVSNKGGVTEDQIAKLLLETHNLRWLFLDMPQGKDLFGTECWKALQQGACPDLEVLWIDSTKRSNGRYGVANGDADLIRSVLKVRADDLKICMVNPDNKIKSRYDPKKDRLDGEKLTDADIKAMFGF